MVKWLVNTEYIALCVCGWLATSDTFVVVGFVYSLPIAGQTAVELTYFCGMLCLMNRCVLNDPWPYTDDSLRKTRPTRAM